METTNYCVIAGASILFLVGCLMHLSENDIFSVEKIKRFKRLIYVLMLEVAVDCIFHLMEGSKISSIVLCLVKGSELIINPVLAFLVFDVFYDRRKEHRDETMRKIYIAIIVILISNVILQMLAIFGWNVFYIDENNMYHRGPLVIVYVVFLVLAILALVRGIFIFSSKTQSTMKITLVAFTALLVIGVFLRNIFANSNYDFLCMSVAIPFLLIYYSHVTLRVDPLTKLLNRQVYQRMIERIDYTTIIFMIDVNNFKHINDTHGHKCGDQILKRLARIVCKAYGEYAHCFRFGGDEFCAILKPGVFDRLIEGVPHYDAYSMAEMLMKRLDDMIASQVKAEEETGNSESYLRYGVSQGYGVYYPAQRNLDKIIRLADLRMYQSKKRFKREHPELHSN